MELLYIPIHFRVLEKNSQAKGSDVFKEWKQFECCSRDLLKPGGGEPLIWAPTKYDWIGRNESSLETHLGLPAEVEQAFPTATAGTG